MEVESKLSEKKKGNMFDLKPNKQVDFILCSCLIDKMTRCVQGLQLSDIRKSLFEAFSCIFINTDVFETDDLEYFCNAMQNYDDYCYHLVRVSNKFFN